MRRGVELPFTSVQHQLTSIIIWPVLEQRRVRQEPRLRVLLLVLERLRVLLPVLGQPRVLLPLQRVRRR